MGSSATERAPPVHGLRGYQSAGAGERTDAGRTDARAGPGPVAALAAGQLLDQREHQGDLPGRGVGRVHRRGAARVAGCGPSRTAGGARPGPATTAPAPPGVQRRDQRDQGRLGRRLSPGAPDTTTASSASCPGSPSSCTAPSSSRPAITSAPSWSSSPGGLGGDGGPGQHGADPLDRASPRRRTRRSAAPAAAPGPPAARSPGRGRRRSSVSRQLAGQAGTGAQQGGPGPADLVVASRPAYATSEDAVPLQPAAGQRPSQGGHHPRVGPGPVLEGRDLVLQPLAWAASRSSRAPRVASGPTDHRAGAERQAERERQHGRDQRTASGARTLVIARSRRARRPGPARPGGRGSRRPGCVPGASTTVATTPASRTSASSHSGQVRAGRR